MEIYVLDALLRRQYVIDRYVSLIWTERFLVYGDFQLNIVSTLEMRTLLIPDTYLAMNKSYYMMRIESVEEDINADGTRVLIIKGYSSEKILADRVAALSLSDTTTVPNWTITLPPAAIMRKLFHDICVTGTLSTEDVIPNVIEGSFLPASTLLEPVDPITEIITPTDVYTEMTKLAAAWNLGFRLLRQDSTGQLYFEVYAGSDRTTDQTALTPVIFSPGLGNLQNIKELTDISNAKNVAYVFSPAGFQMVYPTGVDPTVDGFERRILVVDASDITSTNTTDVPSALIVRGQTALSTAQTSQILDGEVSQNSQYVYGRDYNLGDTVEMQNDDGVVSVMRVTEQIFAQDDKGERSYPTLVLNTYINTGSWLSWMNNKQWLDLDPDTTDVWENQP